MIFMGFHAFSVVKEDFREKEEARFQKETGSKTGANPADALKVSTQSEIDSVHQEKCLRNAVKRL